MVLSALIALLRVRVCGKADIRKMVVLVSIAPIATKGSQSRLMEFSTTPRRTSPYGKSLFPASCMDYLFVSPLKSVVSIRTPHSCGDIRSVIVLWVSWTG